MRQSWTDDRLDDLRDDLNEFRAEAKTEFSGVKAEFVAVRNEMRDESRALRAEMAVGFGQIHERLDHLFLAMIGFGGVMIASLIGLIATRL